MASPQLNPVVRYLRRLTRERGAGDPTDRQLLERFARGGDGEAFADLLRRHGPMVLGVCRRVLGNDHDAEDAFQATFLVLARKAGAIERPHLLGNWLYGVADRTARKARADAARRRLLEKQAPRPEAVAPPESVWQDVAPVLDEEVSRLPDKYRTAFVLCCLEGRTNEEAARRLGCPVGTVLSRLSRARARLRTRLVRRGLTLTAGWLAAELTPTALGAPVPAALEGATAALGPPFAAAAALTPTPSIILAQGVLYAMLVTKLKTVATAFLAVGIVSALGLVAFQVVAQGPGDQQPSSAARATGPDGAEAKKLQALLKERYEAAKAEWDARHNEFIEGRGTLDSALAASRRLLEAERELNDTRADQLLALKSHADRMREVENINKERFEFKRIAIQDLSQATYFRAEAEIWLERARIGMNAEERRFRAVPTMFRGQTTAVSPNYRATKAADGPRPRTEKATYAASDPRSQETRKATKAH